MNRSIKNQKQQIDQLLKIKPKAIMLFRKKKYVESLRELEKAIPIAPSDLELLFYEALCLYHMENVDRASLIVEQLYEMDRDKMLFLLPKVCSLILLKNGKFKKAQNIIDENLKLNPSDLQFLNMLGYAYEKKDQIEDAKKIYKRVLSKDQENANACNSLAYLYISDANKVREASRLIQTALKQEPTNPAYLDTLGMIYVAQGNTKKAIEKLKEALTHAPDNQEILSHINEIVLSKKV